MMAGTATVTWADSHQYKQSTDIPVPVTPPDTVKTSIGTLDFFDGVPHNATVDAVYEYVDRARAVEAFINLTPV